MLATDLALVPQHPYCREAQDHQAEVNPVSERRPSSRKQHAAKRWPHDCGQLPGAAPPGDGIAIEFVRNELRPKRLSGGHQETSRKSAHRNHPVDAAHHEPRGGGKHERQHQEGDGTGHEHHECRKCHLSTVVPVRNMSGVKGRADERKSFGQPNEAQRKLVVCQLIDLPPHHRPLDLHSHCKGEQAYDVPTEVRDPEGRVRVERGNRGGRGLRHAES